MSFYEIFTGEFVELTTSEYVEGVVYDEEGSPINFREPITITGYLVDMDEAHYLIGDKHDSVVEAVEIARVWRVRMIDPQSLIKETLEKFPVPSNPEDVN
jgi:hypothetical protein